MSRQDVEGGIIEQEGAIGSLSLGIPSPDDTRGGSGWTPPTGEVRRDLCLDNGNNTSSAGPPHSSSPNGSRHGHNTTRSALQNPISKTLMMNDSDNFPLNNNKTDLPRLVDRNLAFGQSSNKIQLRHNQGVNMYRLLRYNWFHVLLRWPTRYSFGLLLMTWTTFILIFALIYLWHDEVHLGGQCVLGANKGSIGWAGAFAFSLQTCTTVGKAHHT